MSKAQTSKIVITREAFDALKAAGASVTEAAPESFEAALMLQLTASESRDAKLQHVAKSDAAMRKLGLPTSADKSKKFALLIEGGLLWIVARENSTGGLVVKSVRAFLALKPAAMKRADSAGLVRRFTLGDGYDHTLAKAPNNMIAGMAHNPASGTIWDVDSGVLTTSDNATARMILAGVVAKRDKWVEIAEQAVIAK